MPGTPSGSHRRYPRGDDYTRAPRADARRPVLAAVSGRTATQIRRTGLATAVVSTLGIAMVQTTGIAHSQTTQPYTQADVTGISSAQLAPASSQPGTDSLSDPSLATTKPLTIEQVASERAQQNELDRDAALAELMVTMQQRRVSDAVAEAARRAAALWVRPDIGRLTQGFGGANGHPGIDLGGPYGSDILAAHAGTVIYAGWESGYGNFVQILHAGNVVTCYGHMSRILVSVGEQVKTGQVIGEEGSTGESTGPHLHFEVRIGGQNGTKIDPLTWLASHGVTI